MALENIQSHQIDATMLNWFHLFQLQTSPLHDAT